MTIHLKKFRADELTVVTYDEWVVTVRSKQVTLGAVVVLPKEVWEHFDSVPVAAWSELQKIFADFEHIALGDLSASKINVVAAMMKDPFIHFHLFPRYNSPVHKFGREWTDKAWPSVIEFSDVATDQDSLALVKEHLESLWRDRLCGDPGA